MMLGTQPGNPELYRDFIASKAPDAITREQEIATSGIDQVMDKTVTCFPTGRFFKTPDNVFYDPIFDVVPKDIEGEFVVVPFIWDYQWKGSFKESISMMAKAGKGGKAKAPAKKPAAKKGKKAKDADQMSLEAPTTEAPEDSVEAALDEAVASGTKFACAGITAYKKVVDGNWFIKQKRIPLLLPDTFIDDMGNELPTIDPDTGRLRIFSRPLRADTAQGPRVAISCSEMVPAGTEFYFTIMLMNPGDKEAMLETLD
jgi:hypothetical protein